MTEKLKQYRSKRDFKKTAEPSGVKGHSTAKNKSRKFVVQYHVASRVHYDFRLEWNGVLLSWAVPKGPSYDTRDKRLAVMVEDHPLDYADFEGLIPKGQYGGGTVMLWDEGVWEPQTDFSKGLKAGSLKIILYGGRLKGKWALVRLKSKENESHDNWLMIKENDEYAQDSEGISGFVTSIRSGRTIDEISEGEDLKKKKNPITSVEVQLAMLVDRVPEDDGWLYEVKYDGYRILAFTENGKTRLKTRNDNDYTSKFRRVADSLAEWSAGRAMVLDGEMVVSDENGKTDFQALQHYVRDPDGKDLVYMVFDLLALDGKDLRERPLLERKEKLAALMSDSPADIRYSHHVIGSGRESFEAASELGLEGIIGKRTDSVYGGDRNGDWIKLKCYKRQEFVIGGYTLTNKKNKSVSALLLGVYDGKTLVYSGRAGTGMSGHGAEELERKFSSLITEKAPFAVPPKPRKDEEYIWLKPKLVAEIQFAEITKQNLLRQASFKGLRQDKAPGDVIMEKAEQPKKETEKNTTNTVTRKNAKEIAVLGIGISSPEKLVFKKPEIKKLEVINYYAAVSSRMLPFVKERVLSVVRCHNGVSDSCFFKKHPASEGEGVSVIPVINSEGEKSDYFYIENEKGLISEAQAGSLEFHIWGSRTNNIDKPDMMVFDFDPDEGMDIARVRQGVRDLKSILDKLSLKSFLKTSGGKGYHVVVPFKPQSDWNSFRDFARQIARLMTEKWPDRYTDNIRKNKRAGKIFIDWVRNGRGATSVAPYSLRARPGARVSMPISWKELDTVAPDGVDMFEALKRIEKADPWKDFYNADQKLIELK